MKRMKVVLGVAGLLVAGPVFAGNPILRETDPGFVYACDPAAEVFDGKVYVYCSHDQPDASNYESMKDYVVLESSDLKTWINHGVVLDPQLAPGFEYAHSNMNAPDAAYKDGWYYWYFPSDITEVGVAKSRTPVGPWESAVSNEFTKIFDPTVFVDDDGQAYIYGNDHWEDIGDPGRHIMGARLKDNMVELDGPWIRLSSEEVNEAVHVFKRNGIYYFSARVGKVTQYWMADSPLPQYADFKGELAPNSPASPNHTSAIEFNGEWYLFYHRGDVNHGNSCRRSACFDKMTFHEDGTIEPVIYTLDEGVELSSSKKVKSSEKGSVEPNEPPPPKGSLRHQAEDFSEESGVKIAVQKDGGKSTGLGNISNGDWSCYEKIYFGSNPNTLIPFRVRVAASKAGGTIELRLDHLNGKVIGTIPVSATGGLDQFETCSTMVSGVAGFRTIYLCFSGGSGDLMNLNWFEWAPKKAKRIKKK
ncbi:family 43 glycosylhydrolase [Pontiellaceae bacterium B12219]|nr:family 43 glycosylhydrolase [Pontiellaceae bacterium B12219]